MTLLARLSLGALLLVMPVIEVAAQSQDNGNGGGNGGGNAGGNAGGNGNGGGNAGGNGGGNAGGNGNGGGNAGGNGGGNAGGNGNGGGNAGGNAGGNGNVNAGGPASPPGTGPNKSIEVSSATFQKSAAQVIKLEQASAAALRLAEKTQNALRLALLNSESNVAFVRKVERLLRRKPNDPKLLAELQALRRQLDNADDALAVAYRNHLKALGLLRGERKLLDIARRRHALLRVKRR